MISEKEIKSLIASYKEEVVTKINLVNAIEEVLWPKMTSISFQYWSEVPSNFQTMNRGVILFILKLLGDANTQLNIVNGKINKYRESLNDSLQSYDKSVANWGSLSEYEEMMFGMDRVNITKKIKLLDEFESSENIISLKNQIQTTTKKFEDKKLYYYQDYKTYNKNLDKLKELINNIDI